MKETLLLVITCLASLSAVAAGKRAAVLNADQRTCAELRSVLQRAGAATIIGTNFFGMSYRVTVFRSLSCGVGAAPSRAVVTARDGLCGVGYTRCHDFDDRFDPSDRTIDRSAIRDAVREREAGRGH